MRLCSDLSPLKSDLPLKPNQNERIGRPVLSSDVRSLVSRLSFCVDMMLALGAMCVAEFSPQTLSSSGLDADMEKLNEYIQADKTNEQSVETLYADLQHRFSVMKVRVDTVYAHTPKCTLLGAHAAHLPSRPSPNHGAGGHLKRGNGQRRPAR